MSKIVIADSSCLIVLSKIKKLDILHTLFGDIFIPTAVYTEVVVNGKEKAGVEDVRNAKWIKVENVKNKLAVKALQINLGAGESEAITLAIEKNADLIILDDFRARQAAEEFSLNFVGTLAVLQKAISEGMIENSESINDELNNAGFRFNFKLK
ncbi:MAG: DUF3368 domain-containing protein [Ignavibacteriota bacterium]